MMHRPCELCDGELRVGSACSGWGSELFALKMLGRSFCSFSATRLLNAVCNFQAQPGPRD